MKKLLIISLALCLLCCEQEKTIAPSKGKLQISFQQQKANGSGRTNELKNPAFLLVTITDVNNKIIEQDRKIALYALGNGFYTESLSIPVGNYKLTKCMVLNAVNTVIAATPVAGSMQAKYVEFPLFVGFAVTSTEITFVSVEVVAVTEENPGEFGYAVFKIEEKEVDVNIPLHVLISPKQYFETDGLDSAIITFSSGTKTITKRLDIISPVEAKGKVSSTELSSDGICGSCWSMKVQVYYEVIDEVPYNFHVNESVTELNVQLDKTIRSIKITEQEIAIEKVTSIIKNNPAWNNIAHLTDETGYFHLEFDNNFCNPNFKYEIFKAGQVVDLYYQKSWHETGTDLGMSPYVFKYPEDGGFISKGLYVDNEAFKNINCDKVDIGVFPNTSPSIYFNITLSDYQQKDCYIVWESLPDPHDPNHKAGRVASSQQGYFHLTNEGLEEMRSSVRKKN